MNVTPAAAQALEDLDLLRSAQADLIVDRRENMGSPANIEEPRTNEARRCVDLAQTLRPVRSGAPTRSGTLKTTVRSHRRDPLPCDYGVAQCPLKSSSAAWEDANASTCGSDDQLHIVPRRCCDPASRAYRERSGADVPPMMRARHELLKEQIAPAIVQIQQVLLTSPRLESSPPGELSARRCSDRQWSTSARSLSAQGVHGAAFDQRSRPRHATTCDQTLLDRRVRDTWEIDKRDLKIDLTVAASAL